METVLAPPFFAFVEGVLLFFAARTAFFLVLVFVFVFVVALRGEAFFFLETLLDDVFFCREVKTRPLPLFLADFLAALFFLFEPRFDVDVLGMHLLLR